MDERFDPVVLSKLRMQHPELDVEGLCEWIAGQPNVKNPSGLLYAVAKRAIRDGSWKRGAREAARALERTRRYPEPVPVNPSTSSYAAFRMGLIVRTMSEGLKPRDIARELRDHLFDFPEIDHAEITALESAGDSWERAAAFQGHADEAMLALWQNPRPGAELP